MVHTFLKGISLKVNVTVWLKFELAYYDVAVQHVSHYTMEPLPIKGRMLRLNLRLCVKIDYFSYFDLHWFISICIQKPAFTNRKLLIAEEEVFLLFRHKSSFPMHTYKVFTYANRLSSLKISIPREIECYQLWLISCHFKLVFKNKLKKLTTALVLNQI